MKHLLWLLLLACGGLASAQVPGCTVVRIPFSFDIDEDTTNTTFFKSIDVGGNYSCMESEITFTTATPSTDVTVTATIQSSMTNFQIWPVDLEGSGLADTATVLAMAAVGTGENGFSRKTIRRTYTGGSPIMFGIYQRVQFVVFSDTGEDSNINGVMTILYFND